MSESKKPTLRELWGTVPSARHADDESATPPARPVGAEERIQRYIENTARACVERYRREAHLTLEEHIAHAIRSVLDVYATTRHPAPAPIVSEAAVERAAKAYTDSTDEVWAAVPEHVREWARRQVRAILTAALASPALEGRADG